MLRGQRIEGEMLVADPDQMIDVMQDCKESQQGVMQDVMFVTKGVPAMHDVEDGGVATGRKRILQKWCAACKFVSRGPRFRRG